MGRVWAILIVAGLGLAVTGATVFRLGSAGAQDEKLPQIAQAPGIDIQPDGHFKVRRPANLDGNRAETIYRAIDGRMAQSYGESRNIVAVNYLRWRRVNLVPYRSATHGARYVNNYANAVAKDHYVFDGEGDMPVGSIITKDSFTATAAGDVFTGPLFIVEKMAPGFSAAGGDWRYTMIMPDGTVFGTTNGEGSTNVAFCSECHTERGKRDRLFFVPEERQRRVLLVPAN